MNEFNFSANHLQRLCEVNFFPYLANKLIVFGLRGVLPKNTNDENLEHSKVLEQKELDYNRCRCTIGIWSPFENKIMAFPGSTVPHKKYIHRHLINVSKANQMLTGYYSKYEKGTHAPRNIDSWHAALKLKTNIAYRRTNDDYDFDSFDTIETGNPHDNIHAAFNNNINEDKFGSAGCQVIVGLPKCGRFSENTGPWKVFHDTIYSSTQNVFDYILLKGSDAKRVSESGNQKMSARLRFGSKGEVVEQLQQKFKDLNLYNAKIDGDFGKITLGSVLKFQKKQLGIEKTDGIIGPETAGELGLDLPLI